MKRIKRTDTLGRRLKRVFSQEDKQKLYSEWRNSGLSKFRFCKEKGLSSSAFSLWCKKFFEPKGKVPLKKSWLPLISKEAPQNNQIVFEVKLPNGMVFNTSFEPSQLLSFVKSLINAPTAIR